MKLVYEQRENLRLNVFQTDWLQSLNIFSELPALFL